MDRREFIRVCGAGLFGVAASSALARGPLPGLLDIAVAATARTFDITASEAMVEMVDETQVYMWLFDAGMGPKWPGPVLIVEEGDPITVNFTNALDEPHAFTIPGVTTTGPVAPSATTTVAFTAPTAGTYLYFDDLNAPVNRVLGLHGVMIVKPTAGNTPYTTPTLEVQQLFDDFGTAPLFPGQAWDPMRDWLWVLGNVDPQWHALALAGTPIDPVAFQQGFLARYFAINGKTGYWADHDPTVMLHGYVGQPALIRCVQPGMHMHALHWHANHLYLLAENGVVRDNLWLLDAVMMKPLDCKDVVYPFIKPPDIPDAAWPPAQEAFPLSYPMHCHNEPSQTAAGGSYPHGMIAHIEFLGAGPGGPPNHPGNHVGMP